MQNNEGTIDRGIRAVLGIVAVVLAWQSGVGSLAGVLLLVVGAVLVVTAAVGFCPLYRVLGISTAKQGTSVR